MESDKLNWAHFGEYMNGESTTPCNLDEYLEKIFVRHVSKVREFSTIHANPHFLKVREVSTNPAKVREASTNHVSDFY